MIVPKCRGSRPLEIGHNVRLMAFQPGESSGPSVSSTMPLNLDVGPPRRQSKIALGRTELAYLLPPDAPLHNLYLQKPEFCKRALGEPFGEFCSLGTIAIGPEFRFAAGL